MNDEQVEEVNHDWYQKNKDLESKIQKMNKLLKKKMHVNILEGQKLIHF